MDWWVEPGVVSLEGTMASWTRLFKPRLTADSRVRWFGKLPTYPDYYRSPADEDWAEEFNHWVLKGYELYQNRARLSDVHERRLPISGCVIRLPRTSMTVLASILDFGGDMRGRPFPFCFYVAFPSDQWPGPTHDRVRAAAIAVRELLDLRHDVVRFLNSPGRFESIFSERVLDLSTVVSRESDDSWMGEAKKIPLGEWYRRTSPPSDWGDVRAFAEAAERWGGNLANHEGRRFEPTLRFPLALKFPLDTQIAGWLRWLEPKLNLKRRKLSLVVSGDLERQSGHLSLIARDPMPDDFLLLTPILHTLAYVDDLCRVRVAPENSESQPPSEGHATPLEPGEPAGSDTWSDFVDGKFHAG